MNKLKKKSNNTWRQVKTETTVQNVWDLILAKTVLREKFIATQAYLKKQEQCQIKQSNPRTKETRVEQRKPKLSRW